MENSKFVGGKKVAFVHVVVDGIVYIYDTFHEGEAAVSGRFFEEGHSEISFRIFQAFQKRAQEIAVLVCEHTMSRHDLGFKTTQTKKFEVVDKKAQPIIG